MSVRRTDSVTFDSPFPTAREDKELAVRQSPPLAPGQTGQMQSADRLSHEGEREKSQSARKGTSRHARSRRGQALGSERPREHARAAEMERASRDPEQISGAGLLLAK